MNNSNATRRRRQAVHREADNGGAAEQQQHPRQQAEGFEGVRIGLPVEQDGKLLNRQPEDEDHGACQRAREYGEDGKLCRCIHLSQAKAKKLGR